MVTVADLQAIAGVRSRGETIGKIADAFNKYAAAYGVTSQKAIAQCLANFCVETGGFRHLEENLSYSAKRLTQVWPSRFRSLAAAKPYARNPKKLANKVYGHRLGNENRPGAGWMYRGSGPGQVTGYANFKRIEDITGIPVTSEPHLMRNPGIGMKASLILWNEWGLSGLAEGTQTTKIRKRWNGGSHGLKEVKAAYARGMKRNLSVPEPEQPAEAPPAPEAPIPTQPSTDGLMARKGTAVGGILAVLAASAYAARDWITHLPLIERIFQ